MHKTISLLAGVAALLVTAPASAQSCNESCLLKLADKTMSAIADQDFRRLPWAEPTYFTENNVSMMIGDGWWGSAGETTGNKTFAMADAKTGKVVWFGTIWDHDEPSFGAVRIQAPKGKIEEFEVIAARKRWPIPFGDPTNFDLSPEMTKSVASGDRRSRARLVDLANSYLATKQRNNGALLADFAPGCGMMENGVHVTSAELDVEPSEPTCAASFEAGLFATVDRIRDRRFPVVDTKRGLVLAISVQDISAEDASFRTVSGELATPQRLYPLSRLTAELIKIEGDEIMRVESVVASLPYYMPTPWENGSK